MIAVLLFLLGLLIGTVCGYIFRLVREEYLFRAEERKQGEYQLNLWCPRRHQHDAGCYK